jgi:hypothetical protein
MNWRGEEWTIDRKIPVALIVTIIGLAVAFVAQTMVVVSVGTAWKTDTDSRLAALEKMDANRTTHESRIIILEQSISYIRSDLTEIKLMLKRDASRP